jgi:tRNA threonylcarbamoyladenosine biosynthesis protein TsaE
MEKNIFYSSSPEETIEYGIQIAKLLKQGSVLCLNGDLGAGKTTLIKGIAQGICQIPKREVSSPTFSYLHIYQGPIPLYHFDLYRLRDEKDFQSLGFEEYLYNEGICCFEWAEKIPSLIPKDAHVISIEHIGEEKRKIQWAH